MISYWLLIPLLPAVGVFWTRWITPTPRQSIFDSVRRRHQVYGGVAVVTPGGTCHTRLVTTQVAFKRLNSSEIEGYLESGEWKGKAGAYAIQGIAGAFVKRINGSCSNVVGLPLYDTLALLRGSGFTGAQS